MQRIIAAIVVVIALCAPACAPTSERAHAHVPRGTHGAHGTRDVSDTHDAPAVSIDVDFPYAFTAVTQTVAAAATTVLLTVPLAAPDGTVIDAPIAAQFSDGAGRVVVTSFGTGVDADVIRALAALP